MSTEDDRAAKAARARALLKKRQQQKAAGPASVEGASRVASPSPPPSRTFSPAPSQTSPLVEHRRTFSPAPSETSPLVENHKNGSNLGDLFTQIPTTTTADAQWLSSLERVETPPPAALTSPPVPSRNSQTRAPVPASTTPAPDEREGLRETVRDQQRTISILEADKASLTASLENFKETESKAQQSLALLQEERSKVSDLQALLERVENNANQLTEQVRQQQATISSLEDAKTSLMATADRMKAVESNAQETAELLAKERTRAGDLQQRVQTLETENEEFTKRIGEQQQTINLLVTEKTSLTSSLEKFEDVESKLQETESLLQVERSRTAKLDSIVSRLELEGSQSADRIAQLSISEKQLTDKCRDYEREIHHLTTTSTEFHSQAVEATRRIHELEEQIQSDDRAERLEATLQNTQNRADELEFQLSKLKQTQSALKSERDSLEEQLRHRADVEADLQGRHAEIEKQYAIAQAQSLSVAKERDDLRQDVTSLQTQAEGNRISFMEVQHTLAQTTSELTSNVRQLQQTQNDLKNATRHAEEAEKIQKELQTEGIGLMRSLDEMRPKIVELTDAKLSLGERISSLESALNSRDSTIIQLETTMEELRDQKEKADKELLAKNAALEQERSASHENVSELQKAYAELQTELEAAYGRVHALEDAQSGILSKASDQKGEVDRLTASMQSHGEQLGALRKELQDRTQAQEETDELLRRTQNEMEHLRSEVLVKDEEIERLNQAVSSSLPAPSQHSLDEEMLSALKQQHSLELSSAQSHIRTLEASVFQAEAQVHSLQKQIAALEDEMAHLRPSSRASQRAIPPARIPSRNIDRSDELRRASLTLRRPTAISPTASSFSGLSPETQHKRRVSLSMLKARIDSELATASYPASPTASPAHKPSGLPTVAETSSNSGSSHAHIHKRPQFMDDSHIFWCHSCTGDLVIL